MVRGIDNLIDFRYLVLDFLSIGPSGIFEFMQREGGVEM
jgi:hypothetical protein